MLSFRQQGKGQYDTLDVLGRSVQDVLGEGLLARVARAFATEMSVIYYGLLTWKYIQNSMNHISRIIGKVDWAPLLKITM